MRYLLIAGLVLALGSAFALAALPTEVFFVPAFLGLVVGLALCLGGVLLRSREHKLEIQAAMQQFAAGHGGVFQESLSTDQLPASISLFRCGERQRCTNAIALKCDGRPCLLFRFEYYHTVGAEAGAWYDHYVAYVRAALPDAPDFRLPGSAPAFMDGQRLQYFTEHPGLCVECAEGDLVVWYNRNWARLWRTGWQQSFRPVRAWVGDQLQVLLEALHQVLSGGVLAQEQESDRAKPGPTNG